MDEGAGGAGGDPVDALAQQQHRLYPVRAAHLYKVQSTKYKVQSRSTQVSSTGCTPSEPLACSHMIVHMDAYDCAHGCIHASTCAYARTIVRICMHLLAADLAVGWWCTHKGQCHFGCGAYVCTCAYACICSPLTSPSAGAGEVA